MLFKSIFILTSLLFISPAQAFNYSQLESCLTALRWSYPSGRRAADVPVAVPDSRIIGNITNGSANSYRINALVIPERTDRGVSLHVIQDPNTPPNTDRNGESIYCRNAGIQQTFRIPQGDISSRGCSNDRGGQNISIQTGGNCHGPAFGYFNWSLPELNLSFAQQVGREETQICRNVVDNISQTRTVTGSQLSPLKVRTLSQQAILERLIFMDSQIRAGNIIVVDSQIRYISSAIQAGGSCSQAVETTDEFSRAVTNLLATLSTQSSSDTDGTTIHQ